MRWGRGQCVWWCCFIALLEAILCAPPSNAHADNVHGILTTLPLQQVVQDRMLCASGFTGQTTSVLDKALTSNETDFLANECIAALVRLGRAGQLGFLGTADGRPLNAPLSFDTGFVTAYRKAEQPPAELPAVTALEPIAARCLEQTTTDKDLCYSVGYAYGLRAAQGEQVVQF